MIFQFQYKGFSKVRSTPQQTSMSFAPDLGREPVAFRGLLRDKLPFREAVCALHEVVTGDLRWKPKLREDYKEWAAGQEEIWLAEFMRGGMENKERLAAARAELEELRKRKVEVMKPFYQARQNYFNHIYQTDRPCGSCSIRSSRCIPDEVFFECFSQDESSYGRLVVFARGVRKHRRHEVRDDQCRLLAVPV